MNSPRKCISNYQYGQGESGGVGNSSFSAFHVGPVEERGSDYRCEKNFKGGWLYEGCRAKKNFGGQRVGINRTCEI